MGSASITSKSFEGRYFKFTVSQSGTSTTVNWTFEVLGGSSLYYTASPITLKINGTTVWSKSSITYWDSYAFPAAKGSTSGTYNVGGYGSVSIQLIGNPNWHAAETVSGTVTLDRPTYPVYYNTMGGSGTFNAQTKTYGINLGLHSHKPTKTGYTFQGWATSSGSSTVAYAAGATYTGNARLDLFAVWKADTYAVTYNANGGSGAPANQTKTYGVTLKLQTGKPTRTDYNFLGWGTSASATTVAYAPGANYTGNSALNLYAIWELAYIKPRITNLVVSRCDSAGTVTEDGTNALVAFNWATDKTVSSIKIEWKLASASSYTGSKTVSASGTSGSVNTTVGSGGINADNTYDVRITVVDSGGSSNEVRPLASMEFTLDLLAGGKGAAFGKAAETENLLEVDWDMLVNGKSRMVGTLNTANGIESSDIGNCDYIVYPEGGSYRGSSSSAVGWLKITLPVSWTNTMLTFKLSLYNYDAYRETTEYTISGYNYSYDSRWYSTDAYCEGNGPHANLPVTFGHDGERCCILIGWVSTSWCYVQAQVHDVIVGYEGKNYDMWSKGWDIEIITDTSNITALSGTTQYNTGQIYRNVAPCAWYQGRDGALIKTEDTSPGSLFPILSIKTQSGSWELGTVREDLYITYVSDEDYRAGLNNTRSQYKFTANVGSKSL